MYKSFFHLRESPFNVNVDPRFFYPTRQSELALQKLMYGIQNRKGLILLTGEVGTGKTMLINQLLNWLRETHTPTAFVFNSNLGEGDLFNLMACDFGIAHDPEDKSKLPIRMNRWVLECHHAGVSPVLIVDEAQGLSFDRLEEIRLLSNIETPYEKMLQIVFAGQPELEEHLNQPEGQQIRQRIAVRCKIGGLTLEQTHGYIEQRLRIAGAIGEPIFERQAMDAVYFYARGTPRVINLICEHSLINAYVDQLRPVPASTVEQVAAEFQLEQLQTSGAAVASNSAAAPVASQSIFGWQRTPVAPTQEPAETERAHAAVAGGSSRSPQVSHNIPAAPALLDMQAISVAASMPQALPPSGVPFVPSSTLAPIELPRRVPLILPAPSRASAVQHASVGAAQPTSRAIASGDSSREVSRAVADVHSIENLTRQRHWVSKPNATETLRRWVAVRRDRCLSIVSGAVQQLLGLPALRWLTAPRPQVHHARTHRRWISVHDKPSGVQNLRHRDWIKRLEANASNIVLATRHLSTSVFRWLQQPVSSAHRR